MLFCEGHLRKIIDSLVSRAPWRSQRPVVPPLAQFFFSFCVERSGVAALHLTREQMPATPAFITFFESFGRHGQ
jgi:hypothetical protein